MYDLRFIFEECGFGWTPPHIKRELLYNVSYDLGNGQIKLYVLDESRKFLHKISGDGTIAQQHEARARGADSKNLADFLGASFDFEDLQLDTVEGDVYYLLIEAASPSEYSKFLNYLCIKLGLSKSQFLAAVRRINNAPVENMFECLLKRAVSGVRVGLSGRNCKIYSRPFKTGNGFDLNETTRGFLRRLYGCDDLGLTKPLERLWVSADLFSDRTVIVTQEDDLL